MSSYINILYAIHYDGRLVWGAIAVHQDLLPHDYCEAPMEPEHRAILQAMLPQHVRSMGEIVEISLELFDVAVIGETGETT